VALFPGPALAAERASGQRITIIMNPQGGSGGTLQIDVESGTKMSNIVPPTRWGYDFAGYWSAASARGTQYYNAQGAPTVANCDFTQNTALYAHWTIKTMHIIYQNMDGATPGASAPNSHTYGANTKVPDPAKAGYTFFGWQVNDSTVASQGLVLGAAAYNANITLTAVWNKAALVALVNSATEAVTMLGDDLRKVFHHQVTDPTAGVTIDDLNSEEVKLTLTAKNADNLAEGAADIIKLAQGEVLKFYDFSISKTVTKLNGNPVITNLQELPNTVQVEITLGNSLKDSSAYRVYRYHGGKAEAIPHGPITDPTDRRESFELSADGTKLILHTRRLSTYAVVGSEKALGGSGTIERDEAGLDVQAQVLEGGSGPVYKIDIKFGKMYFTYSTGRTWDPNAHRYTDVRIYDWIPDACYTGGNNEVTVFNHSNADVSVGFAVNPIVKAGASESLLNGVDMVMKNENRADGTSAQDVFLSKV
ncbi:MAG: InlB B-repeat-containing protein, partial [Oscillospiraceae bacterium]